MEGWIYRRLGKIADFKNGKTIPFRTLNGTFIIFGGNGLIGSTENFNSSGEKIIIGRVGAYCGNVIF